MKIGRFAFLILSPLWGRGLKSNVRWSS